ncbi:MFS transporter [Sciscionella sediminilitoris]|uniref:MFS transporter n=1 Tax=Sciscionella sediminilitoris TaxID=1445613 RepID=UPI000B2BCB95|nr:MFS transporter [Sciscionella sp. SE31]
MSTPAETRAKEPTGRGGGLRYRWAVLSMNFLVLGLNYADRAAIGVAAPVIMAEYGFSKSSWGWISAAFFLGYAPFCFIGGYTADKFGPRKVMAVAVAWWSLFTALTAAGFGFVSFLVIRFFFGFGEGPQATVTAKTMSNWFPQRQLGTAMGLSQASTPLGGAVGTPLVVALMNAFHGDWRAPFIILGVIGVLFVIGWWTVVRDRPEGFRRVRPAEIAEMAAEERAHPVEAENGGGSRWRYLRNPVVLTTALAYFGYSWVLYAFLNWFPDFLSEAHGLDLNSIAFTGSIPWLCGFVGLAIGGVLTDALGRKFGVFGARKWTVVLGMLLVAIAFAGVGVVDSTTASVTLMAVVVFILYIVGAQFFALIAPVVPRASFGSVSGFVHFIANIAGIIGPVAIGYLGWGTAFGLSAAIAAVPVLALAVFGRGPRKAQTTNAAL